MRKRNLPGPLFRNRERIPDILEVMAADADGVRFVAMMDRFTPEAWEAYRALEASSPEGAQLLAMLFFARSCGYDRVSADGKVIDLAGATGRAPRFLETRALPEPLRLMWEALRP